MIRTRNIDPGQWPSANQGIFGTCIHDSTYWTGAVSVNNTGGAVPPGAYLTLAATAARPIPMAQAVGLITAGGVATNGAITLRVLGINQFLKPVFMDVVIPNATGSGTTILNTATDVNTKVFRQVTGILVIANANTAAVTVQFGVYGNNAQNKIGVPTGIAKAAEAVRLISYVAIGGVFTTLGTASTVDLLNMAIMPGALVFTAQGTLVEIQMNITNYGQRG